MYPCDRDNRAFFGLVAAASRTPAPLYNAEDFVRTSAVRFAVAALLGGLVATGLAVSVAARHPLRLVETQTNPTARLREDYPQHFRVLVSFPHPDADSPPELQLLDMATAKTALAHGGTLVTDPLYDNQVLLSSTIQGVPAEVLCDISEAAPDHSGHSGHSELPPDQPRKVDIQSFAPAQGQSRCIYAASPKAFTPLDFTYRPDRNAGQATTDQSAAFIVSGFSAIGLFAFGAWLLVKFKATPLR